jgi:hypothetical protein
MSMRMSIRHLALAVFVLACAGCVAFERAPVTKFECDPDLAGGWQGLPKLPSLGTILVDNECLMQWPQDDDGVYSMRLRTFAIDAKRYLAFSPEEADRLLDPKDRSMDLGRLSPENSVYLVRYRIEDGQLNLWMPDPDAVLQGIAAGAIRGRKIDDSFAYVQGNRRQIARLLRESGQLYDNRSEHSALQFRRLKTERAP